MQGAVGAAPFLLSVELASSWPLSTTPGEVQSRATPRSLAASDLTRRGGCHGDPANGAWAVEGRRKDQAMTAASEPGARAAAKDVDGEGPERAGLVLVALILAAAVANLNLAVANV